MLVVAPLVGAWIEILVQRYRLNPAQVAPLVGAWIEIVTQKCINCEKMSLLSWERGLKSKIIADIFSFLRRSSRGSVD